MKLQLKGANVANSAHFNIQDVKFKKIFQLCKCDLEDRKKKKNLKPHGTPGKISCSDWNCTLVIGNECFSSGKALTDVLMADIFSFFPCFPSASILPLSSESINIKIKAQK